MGRSRHTGSSPGSIGTRLNICTRSSFLDQAEGLDLELDQAKGLDPGLDQELEKGPGRSSC